MADGKIKGTDIIDESVFQQFARLDKTILDEIKNVNKLESSIRNALSGSAVDRGAKETADAVKKANTALTEQEKVFRELNRIRERNRQVTRDSLQDLQNERTRRNQVNAALRQEATLSSSLTSAYKKLRIERDKAANTLRDLVVNEKASNRELRNAQREFNRLDQRVRKADKAVGNFRDNVGNYRSALVPTIGLTRELLGAFGLYSALQVGRDIFETTKQLDQLRFGLEQVTKSQDDFNASQLFLDNLADRAGVNLVDLTRRYINFRAAADTTTLSLEEVEEVFTNVVVAGSVLGRSTDDINGALRALEQILSKGKVQAEELRGQLGERLPGAFQILEKALGLTNGELNELLEVGGLLSVDAIPALARGLEEAYKLDTVNRVENLAASQARLTTEWQIFLRDLEKGTGVIGTVYKAMTDFLTASIRGFQILARSSEDNRQVFDRWAETNAFNEQMATMREEAERTGQTLRDVAKSYQSDFINQLNLTSSNLDAAKNQLKSVETELENLQGGFVTTGGRSFELREEQKQLKEEIERLERVLTQYKGGLDAVNNVLAKAADETGKLTQAEEDQSQTLAKLRDRLEALRKEREGVDYVQDRQRINELNGEIAKTEELIAKLTGTYKANSDAQKGLAEAGTEKFLEDLKRTLEALIERSIVGSDEWFEYKNALDGVNESIKNLRAEAALLSGDLSSLDFINVDDLNFADEIDNFLNTEGLDVILGDFANRFKLNKAEIIAEYKSLYGEDFTKFKEYEENKLKVVQLIEQQKLELRQRTLDLADALSQAFLEIQLQRLDEEKEQQEEVFNSVVNNKDSSEEQIALAEKKREENEKRIEKERQKRENQAFLFRQALSVADILIADALARANAVASTAAIIPYIPFGAAALATLQALISTNTALAIGAVLAQSVPKFFFMGKGLGDNYQGPAIWGELQREVKVGKDGSLEVSPDGASPTYVKSSDMILKSMSDFRKQMGNSNSEVYRRVSRGMDRRNTENIRVLASTGALDISGLDATVERAILRGMSKARLRTDVHVHSDVPVRRVP